MLDQETREAIAEAVRTEIRELVGLPSDYSQSKAAKLLRVHYNTFKDMLVADKIKVNALGRVPRSEIERVLGEPLPLEKYLSEAIENHSGKSVKQ